MALNRSQSATLNEKTANPETKTTKKKIVKIVRKVVTKGSSTKKADLNSKSIAAEAEGSE